MLRKIAVLVSGGGTNLQAILDAEKSQIIKSGQVALVISNNENAYALKRAEHAQVKWAVVKDDKRLVEILREEEIDLVVLAGYLKILSKEVIEAFEDRIINIHPSLIPSFCGKGYYGLKVHEKALEYGVKVSGATVHFVNEIPDAGKIISQKAVYIEPGETAESLQKKIMEQAEWIILPQAIEQVLSMLK